MKKIILGLCVLGSTVAVNAQSKPSKPAAAKKPATAAKSATAAKPAVAVLKSSVDSFSYAVGVNIANSFKSQSIDQINTAVLKKALDDVMGGKTMTLTQEQCGGVLQQAMVGLQQKAQAKMSASASAEKAKSAAFLEANKKRKEVITLPSGLQYEVLKAGDPSSPKPALQDTFVAHYAGTLIDGKEFDNSIKRGTPLEYPVSAVIPGWTEALQLMHVGDKWKIYIPSDLGYGDRGAGADIPGGAALIFEMELLGIKPAAKAEDKK